MQYKTLFSVLPTFLISIIKGQEFIKVENPTNIKFSGSYNPAECHIGHNCEPVPVVPPIQIPSQPVECEQPSCNVPQPQPMPTTDGPEPGPNPEENNVPQAVPTVIVQQNVENCEKTGECEPAQYIQPPIDHGIDFRPVNPCCFGQFGGFETSGAFGYGCHGCF